VSSGFPVFQPSGCPESRLTQGVALGRPGYPTPLALNIPSAQQNFTLTNVSIPVGQGYVILMSDIYNSSNIVSGRDLACTLDLASEV
jgi:hypothetical protein